MENLIKNGDYVPDGQGGFVRLEGRDALLQRVLFRLSCRRGGFPLLPELGSQLWKLGREKPADREMTARQYCVQALQPEPVQVKNVTVTRQDDALLVTVELDYEGETLTAEVRTV